MITIVSGLPRSGTSLMMQMLAAGGMDVLTDGERRPDEDNPRGYYEWERAKLLPREPSLIGEAEGKAVKVISQLLMSLPADHDYRVIFMERPLEEVVASQAEMIKRRGTAGPGLGPAQMKAALQAHLNQVMSWVRAGKNVTFHLVSHHELIGDPAKVAGAVKHFLDIPLNTEAMAEQVDQKLYRQRK
ncbi:MAG TPA: hypothetical protein VF753_11615 [Terriglobales bacterium]